MTINHAAGRISRGLAPAGGALLRILAVVFMTALTPIVLFGPSSALAAALPSGLLDVGAPEADLAPPAASAAAATPRFVASAVGAVARSTDLVSAPTGGSTVAALAAGSRVSIGGKVPVPAGFLPRHAYWVRADSPDGPLHGFLQERSVIVTAGVVPRLDLAGVSSAALLDPTGSAAGDGVGSASAAWQAAGGLPAGASGPAGQASAKVAAAPMAGGLAARASYASLGVSASTGASVDIAWLPDTVIRWLPAIEAAAARHGVDPALVAIVVLVESGGNPEAVSPSGAVGLMQVMPGTALDIATRRGLDAVTAQGLSDPETNLDLGAWYLADMLRAFGVADDPDWQRSVEIAAAAYNGGPGHVGQHLTTGQPLFAESSRYRVWVGGMWRERTQGSSVTLDAWLEAGGQRLVDSARSVMVALSY